ncbi:MAG TPA: ATP-binding protein [Bacteroidia bacterium]
MSKLHDIESKLLKINDSVFQTVCDAYLYFTEAEYPELHRTGSQVGKQKTKKGTPDTYFKLKNGKYVLVEYTTKERSDSKAAFIKKIKDDINKCINEKVTKIKVKSIQKIIYCHNSTLDSKESNPIIEFYKKKNVKVIFKDAHTIAMGLYGRCPHIAKEFLGIQIDTAQILTPKTFAQEYGATGIATPLNNKFYFRDEELKTLIANIKGHSITILTGAPGVGKSRLALAALDEVKKDTKQKFTVYCISNKGIVIYDDLRSYLKPDKNYLVLIDDANRQLEHLITLMAMLRESRKGKIKIVLTVRDYALEILTEKCKEFLPEVQNIKKLTHDELKEILKSSDFNITNPDYYNRILDIANGNPRLAIMAAKVAKQSKSLSDLNDVSVLYDQYFGLALTDVNVLKDKNLLKALGLVSFFYSIDRSREEFMDGLCKNFKIDQYTFNESIEKLEQLELLETSVDMNMVKISDQVLSTYFFYKVFLKDKVLDFSVILNNYFGDYNSRIKDTVIPANNTFGYENVYEKINPFLDVLWKNIKTNEEIAFKFLDLFWFYRSANTFAFIYYKLEKQPAIKSPVFDREDNQQNRVFVSDSDKLLGLLCRYYYYPSDDYLPALELGFEYVQKNPQTYLQFKKAFVSDLLFSYEDYRRGFYRQTEFIKQLKSNHKKKLHTAIYFDVIPALMRTHYNISSSSRQKNVISFYHYDIPLNDPIKVFRKTVWEMLNIYAKTQPEEVIEFFHQYKQQSTFNSIDVYIYDSEFVVNHIEKHLSPKSLEHCYLVQSLISWFTRIKVLHPKFQALKAQFTNKQYKNYLVLSYNRLRDKEDFEFENYEEYRKLKAEEIAKTFSFKTIAQFKVFYKEYLFIHNWKYGKNHEIRYSLETVLTSNYTKNSTLGLNMLKEIILSGNQSYFNSWQVVNTIIQSGNKTHIDELYNLLIKNNYQAKVHWLLYFYQLIPAAEVQKKHVADLQKVFKGVTDYVSYIDTFSHIDKFIKVQKDCHVKLLQEINKQNTTGKSRLILEHDFFIKHISKFKGHIPLLKATYLQQDNLDNIFDHDFKCFLELVKVDPSFFTEYLKHITTNSFSLSTREYQNLSVVWQLPNVEKMIKDALALLLKTPRYTFGEHFGNALFERLDAANTKRAIRTLKEQLKKWKSNQAGLKIIFDIVRHSFKGHINEFVKEFLNQNQNLAIFKKIDWVDTSFFGSGDTIWADVKAKQYEEILSIVKSIKEKSYRFAQHIEFLDERITYEKSEADRERKVKFMFDRY